jgi:predicted pyridoxine 5'-phosphate oxidase superfamily flavin-nucleotide-binding protein
MLFNELAIDLTTPVHIFVSRRHTGSMGKTFESIDDRLAEWLVGQPVFFVATAPLSGDGSVNCSPKGNRNEFVILGPHTVAYLDQTGSGIETIAHLRENGRIVIMFCAFNGPPKIVRLHGTGRAVLPDSREFASLADHFGAARGVGVRSIILIEVERISDSCGYGVPLMSFEEHRPTMDQWSQRKGASGIRDYWLQKNRTSVDDLEGLDLA